MALPTDLAVRSLLAELAKDNDYVFKAPRPVIHAAFARVADEVPGLFPKLNFGKYGSLMNSEEIDYVWRTLVMNGYISTDNPALVVHRVRHLLAKHFEREHSEDVPADLRPKIARAKEVFVEALDDLASEDRVDDLLVRRA